MKNLWIRVKSWFSKKTETVIDQPPEDVIDESILDEPKAMTHTLGNLHMGDDRL